MSDTKTQTTAHALVHKKDHEGMIRIDILTGEVDRSEELPEWASELAIAQLAERTLWLTNTFGPTVASEHHAPELFAFEELGWLTVTAGEDGELVESYVQPDREHRMEMAATLLGVDLSELDHSKAFAKVDGIVAEAEITLDYQRTDAEMADFRASQTDAFDSVEERKTGTQG